MQEVIEQYENCLSEEKATWIMRRTIQGKVQETAKQPDIFIAKDIMHVYTDYLNHFKNQKGFDHIP